MRMLLGIVLVLALIITVVGFNRGWFQVTTSSEPGRQVDVNLRVDPNQIEQDVEQVKQEARDIVK